MSGPWKCYRAWLRLKARKARGEAMLAEMRGTWTRKKEWHRGLTWTRGPHKGDNAGMVLFVGEENLLGTRRLRIIQNDLVDGGKGDEDHRHLMMTSMWQEAVLWRERIGDDDKEDADE